MITVLLLFTLFFLLCFQLIKKSFWSQLGIPEIRGLPIVGNLMPVILRKKSYFETIWNLYNLGEGKDYIGIYNGTQPTLLIRNPDLIEIMLKEEANNFEDRGLYSDFSDPLSLNLFYLKGKLWKWTRSKLRPAFSNIRLKTVYGGIELCTIECLNSLGPSVNIKEIMEQYSCNVISKTVFCVQDNTGFIENSYKVFSLSGLSGIAVLLRIFIPQFALSIGIKTVPQEIEAFYRNAIARSTRVPGSFLDLMLHLKETEPGMKFALLEMKIFLSSVILNYNIKLNSATVEPLLFDPTSLFYKAMNPILLDFEKTTALSASQA